MEASNVHVIKSEVREQILKRFVKEGDSVKKGQLLMELSRTDTQIEFEQKKNELQDSKADLAKAKRELRIQKKLFKNSAVPETQVEDARQSLRKIEARTSDLMT